MLELILKIREHTEAGSILEHMYLFDELQSIKFVGMYCGVNAWALDVDDDILVDEVEAKTCENCIHIALPCNIAQEAFYEFGANLSIFSCTEWKPK